MILGVQNMVIGYVKIVAGLVSSAIFGEAATHAAEPLGRSSAVEIGAACALGMVLITTTVWLVGGRQRLIDGQEFLKNEIADIKKRLDALACTSPKRLCEMLREAQEIENEGKKR